MSLDERHVPFEVLLWSPIVGRIEYEPLGETCKALWDLSLGSLSLCTTLTLTLPPHPISPLFLQPDKPSLGYQNFDYTSLSPRLLSG